MSGTVKYKIEKESPLKQYIFDFLFNILGIRGRKSDSGSKHGRLDIYYGNHPPEGCKIVVLEKATDIIWKQLIEGNISENDIDGVVKFDIVNAISLLITDEVNRNLPEEAYDTHERLMFGRSFQAENNVATVPVVNLYVNFLRILFERVLGVKGIPLWPKGKKCAIGLSHDVDMPDRCAILKQPVFHKSKNLRYHLIANLKRTKAVIEHVIGKGLDSSWLFEDIMREEARHGFGSTFFFASVNQYDKWGSAFDVAYDIQQSKFATAFKNIADQGFEVGLHASYNAYLNDDHFVFEKEKLENMAGVKVAGLRHHYWHMGKDELGTLRMHEAAGFEYDSSIAFNNHIGFRRNIALPYFVWDDTNKRTINAIQLPVFCMDGNILYRQWEILTFSRRLKDYLDSIKRTGGVGVIDWHVRVSFPKNSVFPNWGQAYVKLLERLSHDDGIWVASLGEINSWLRKRNKLIQEVDAQSHEMAEPESLLKLEEQHETH